MPARRSRAGGDEPPRRLRLSEPSDLVGIVPYLLGFHPRESVVVILIRDRQVKLTARMDLPPPADVDLVIEQASALADTHDATAMVLAIYSANEAPARIVGAELTAGLAEYVVLDSLYVSATRWWSLMCIDGCCPAEGTPYDLSSHPVAAEAVYAGLSASADRSVIEAQVLGPPAGEAGRLRELAVQAMLDLEKVDLPHRCRLMAALVESFLDHTTPLDEADGLQLAALAGDVAVRDVAWAMMTRAEADAHVDLWCQVVAITVAPLERAPLCLLGAAAWILGNGALQNCCVDRVRRIDPDYSMAKLLADINDRALPPRYWDQLSAQLRSETGVLAG